VTKTAPEFERVPAPSDFWLSVPAIFEGFFQQLFFLPKAKQEKRVQKC